MANAEFVDDQWLVEELTKFDVPVSKITDKNRDILIKKLNHMRARQRAGEAPPSPPRRQSPGRRKRSPPRRSIVPPDTYSFSFSSSDDNDTPPRASERQKNLRRRTVDSGLTNRDRKEEKVATPAGRGDSRAATDEQAAAWRSKRRSIGATSNSPFLAGSLRNPKAASHSAGKLQGPLARRTNDSLRLGELSGSDDDASYVEVATAEVNTTQSLYGVADTIHSSLPADLASQRGLTKLRSGESGIRVSVVYQLQSIVLGNSADL